MKVKKRICHICKNEMEDYMDIYMDGDYVELCMNCTDDKRLEDLYKAIPNILIEIRILEEKKRKRG